MYVSWKLNVPYIFLDCYNYISCQNKPYKPYISLDSLIFNDILKVILYRDKRFNPCTNKRVLSATIKYIKTIYISKLFIKLSFPSFFFLFFFFHVLVCFCRHEFFFSHEFFFNMNFSSIAYGTVFVLPCFVT